MKYALKHAERMKCDKKLAYPTSRKAWLFSAHMFRKFGKYRSAYKCKHCWQYHLTSQPKDPSNVFWEKMEKWFGVSLRT